MSNIMQVFDEKQKNLLYQQEYRDHENRQNGFSGIAESKLFNKILLQTSSVCTSFVLALEKILDMEFKTLDEIYVYLENLYTTTDIAVKREAQGKFRCDIFNANINDAAIKQAMQNGITEAEENNSYGLGYALALYGGLYSGLEFETLYNLDKLADIKDNAAAMNIINGNSKIKTLWDKYVV